MSKIICQHLPDLDRFLRHKPGIGMSFVKYFLKSVAEACVLAIQEISKKKVSLTNHESSQNVPTLKLNALFILHN